MILSPRFEIGSGGADNGQVVLERSYCQIAFAAKKPANLPRRMAMVNTQGERLSGAFVDNCFFFAANRAYAILISKHSFVVFERDAEHEAKLNVLFLKYIALQCLVFFPPSPSLWRFATFLGGFLHALATPRLPSVVNFVETEFGKRLSFPAFRASLAMKDGFLPEKVGTDLDRIGFSHGSLLCKQEGLRLEPVGS